MKGLFLVFVFAILFVSSVGFVDVVSAAPRNATLAGAVPDSCPPEMVNLTTSVRKLNFADPVNSARTLVTSADMPNTLASGILTDLAGYKYRYNQTISPQYAVGGFGTSSGDIPNPVLNYQVGTNPNLYWYTVNFDNPLNLSNSNGVWGQTIKILGEEYTIGDGSSSAWNAGVIYLHGGQRITLMGGDPPKTINIEGIVHTVELVSTTSDTSAKIVFDGVSKTVTKGASYAFAGNVTLYVKDIHHPDFNGDIRSIDLIIGPSSKSIELRAGNPARVGSDSLQVPGTLVGFTYVNGFSGLIRGFGVGFGMQSSQKDHVALGESFLNPVFGRLSFVFDNANPNLNDASRAMVKTRTDNNQYGYVTFNSARSGATGSKELIYVYDSNTNSTGVAPILAHQTVSTNGKGIIQIQEGGAVKQNDWVVINQGDAGTILEVTDMSIDSATSGKITFQDVITGESQTITLTNLTGQGYIKTGVNFYGGSGYTIKMDQNGVVANVFWNNATRAIFPRIALKNGGWIAFLTAAKVSSTESLILPNGRLTLPTTGKQFGSIAINQRKSLFVDGVNWTGISQSSGTITIDRISNYELGSNATGIGGRITTDKGNIIEVTDLTVDSATTGKATFQDVITGESQTITLTNVSGYYQKSSVRIFGGVYTIRMNQAGNLVSWIWTIGMANCNFDVSKGPTVLIFEPRKWDDIGFGAYGDYVCIPLTTTGSAEIAIGDPAIDGVNSGYVTLTSDTYQKQAVDQYGTLFIKEDRTNENGVATIKYPTSQMYFNALLTAPCVNPTAIRLAPETCDGFSGWIKKLFGKC